MREPKEELVVLEESPNKKAEQTSPESLDDHINTIAAVHTFGENQLSRGEEENVRTADDLLGTYRENAPSRPSLAQMDINFGQVFGEAVVAGSGGFGNPKPHLCKIVPVGTEDSLADTRALSKPSEGPILRSGGKVTSRKL